MLPVDARARSSDQRNQQGKFCLCDHGSLGQDDRKNISISNKPISMENSSSDERADGFGYDSEPALVPKRRKIMLDGEDGSDEEARGSSMMLVDDEATVDSGAGTDEAEEEAGEDDVDDGFIDDSSEHAESGPGFLNPSVNG